MRAIAARSLEKMDREQPNGPAETRVPTASELYFSATAADDDRQQALEQNFFSSIRLRNGTYKYTYPHRLDDLNDLVKQFLPAERPLKLMDVAVSSGVSTLEWMDDLERAGIEHHMTAGDLTVKAFLISVGKNWRVLTDSTGYPLQFDLRGKAIPNPPGKRNLARHFLPLLIIKAALAARFSSMREAAAKAEARQVVSRRGMSCRPLTLVSPRLARPSNLSIIEDDILSGTAFENSFHVLRAANILNRCYFDDPQLVEILRRLRSRLMRGGVLVVCRTIERNENHGSVFALDEAGRFEVRARIGNGSEIEDLVLGLQPRHNESFTEVDL